MAEVRGALRRQDLPQRRLDLHRVLQVVDEPEAVRQADAVRVHHGRAGDAEHVAQDEVRGLAPDARQGRQLLHRTRQLAAVLFQQHLRAGYDVARLGPVEAAGADVFLDLSDVGAREALQRGETLKKGGRDLVDALVGALGGKAYGKEQLVVLSPIERARGLRIFLQQQAHDLAYLFGCSHSILSYLFSSIAPPHSMTGSSCCW